MEKAAKLQYDQHGVQWRIHKGKERKQFLQLYFVKQEIPVE